MPKILYKLPSRSRPDKCIKTIENIVNNAEHEDYLIWVSADVDDTTMTNISVRDKIASFPKVNLMYGGSSCKVEAINRDMEFIGDWDICIVMADDMVWDVKGFDKKIISLFEQHFPDYDGFIHTPDGTVNERLPTMCVIGKKLYDYFGYLYNPIYKSVYCDNEQFDVVRLLNKYHYEPVRLFTHMHPIWRLGEMDDLYRRNEDPKMYGIDGHTYTVRKSINFGL